MQACPPLLEPAQCDAMRRAMFEQVSGFDRAVPLDLGRKNRLFSAGQAIALSARYDSCAAEGCDRPFAWSELHHVRPWGEGGATDLENAMLLCSWHHHRIHDRAYRHRRLPDGSVRFHRRT